MLNLNSRQKDLIKLMINESNYKTMNEYAGILKISPRTLYSDIEIINNHLKSFQTEIQKKPRVGIKLCGNHQEKMQLLKNVNSKCDIKNQYSTEERHLEIMKMLFIDEQTISYKKLADYFWVSKTSICNDMDLIQGALNDRTVGIESDKKGTRIVGSEAQKQYTLQIYTENMLKKSNISNEEDFLKYGPVILKKIYPEDIVDTVLKEVEKFEKNQNIYLSYTYLKSLVVTIIVFVFRLSRKKHITLKKNFIFEEIKSLETYFIAETMLNSISQKLNIDIIKDDIDYLNKQLLAHSINPEINDEKEIKKYHDMVK
ncbi:MAG: HTH domain-containing protein [Clostridium sp.]|uniref:BglG family transcription antiterminator n=1 Tax=Clostridium sp. TaxID=1506 RepID=UPI002A87C864|nr:HTH domain-containing protein [Clostridium sp.]MDY5098688.1 HTH domain-containing protein [Clostridium sp.]